MNIIRPPIFHNNRLRTDFWSSSLSSQTQIKVSCMYANDNLICCNHIDMALKYERLLIHICWLAHWHNFWYQIQHVKFVLQSLHKSPWYYLKYLVTSMAYTHLYGLKLCWKVLLYWTETCNEITSTAFNLETNEKIFPFEKGQHPKKNEEKWNKWKKKNDTIDSLEKGFGLIRPKRPKKP